jgi:hypothetical protein
MIDIQRDRPTRKNIQNILLDIPTFEDEIYVVLERREPIT